MAKRKTKIEQTPMNNDEDTEPTGKVTYRGPAGVPKLSDEAADRLMQKLKREALTNPKGPVRYGSSESYDKSEAEKREEAEEFNLNWMSWMRR